MTTALEEILPFAILTLTRDYHVHTINHHTARLLGEITGLSLYEVFDPSDEITRFVSDAFRHGTTLKAYDFSFNLKGKPTLRAHITLFPVAENEVMILFDILSGMEGMEKLVAQQHVAKRAALMTDMLAHEIKNPLASIRGAAQLLEGESPETKELTSLIIRESDRICTTLERVAFLNHSPSDKRDLINIHEILHEAKRSLNPKTIGKITIEERFDPSLPLLSGQKETLVQLFINLMKNAIEAIEYNENAHLIISTSCPPDIRLRRDGQRIIPIAITIIDNGTGISPELQPTLFDPYVTTKKDGNGLGLTIAAKITSDHGGVIELLHSKKGSTAMRVLLPSSGS